MMTPIFLSGLVALAGATPVTAPSGAPVLADLFVDASANCASGNGTAVSPFCSIGDAVAIAVNGDVIRVAGGTYVENLSLAANVALIGTDGQAVTVIDGGLNGAVVTVQAGSSVTMEGLTVTGGSESGISNRGSLLLTNSTVSGNAMLNGYGGGGVSNDQQMNSTETLTMRSVTISGNSNSLSFYSYGGGVYSTGGIVTIEDSTIEGNTTDFGAGICAFSTDLTVAGTTIQGNMASYGAGIYSFKDLTVVNSTVSGNTGGGIEFRGSSLDVRGSTIVNNVGGDSGLSNRGVFMSTVTVSNSVIAGSSNAQSDTDVWGNFGSAGFNFIGSSNPAFASGFVDGVNGDQVGMMAVPLDPLLGALADNGGATLTHQPLGGSPLINGANQANFEPLDQRGIVRIAGSVDIGSTEDTSGSVPGCTSVANSTGAIGSLTISGSLAAADDNFVLTMSNLPTRQFGIFLVAPVAGFQANSGGSAGNLCLGSPAGRFTTAGQVINSGPSGSITLQIPLTMLPQGNGFVAAQPGETWFFQGWHRDVVAGTATSNFSSATGVLFH